jgi:hypothetical protein
VHIALGLFGYLIYGLSWVVHAVFFRGQWEVEVFRAGPRLGRLRPPPINAVYRGYSSREEAIKAMNDLAQQIAAGTWVSPTGQESLG